MFREETEWGESENPTSIESLAVLAVEVEISKSLLSEKKPQSIEEFPFPTFSSFTEDEEPAFAAAAAAASASRLLPKLERSSDIFKIS